MSRDIDDLARDLSAAREGDLDERPVVGVADDGDAVTLTLGLPSGDRFSRRLARPPVWGANCDLKRLLDACGLGPDEVEALEGETVPCTRSVVDGDLEFAIDFDALADGGD